ncbi:hypothetical protein LZ32DRAFT_445870 [Colletotrichum eremochloae]|nr:hypothetical protein LZ32DRAFT_445870 [Colletotrichum eremochloae]
MFMSRVYQDPPSVRPSVHPSIDDSLGCAVELSSHLLPMRAYTNGHTLSSRHSRPSPWGPKIATPLTNPVGLIMFVSRIGTFST